MRSVISAFVFCTNEASVLTPLKLHETIVSAGLIGNGPTAAPVLVGVGVLVVEEAVLVAEDAVVEAVVDDDSGRVAA